MPTPAEQRPGIWTLVASVALVVWGGVGLYQGLHSGFSGGIYDPGYVVPGVMAGSLAEKAGLRAGDRVISVDGTPVERLGMESRWPRRFATRIGGSRRFVVERNGEEIPIDVVYGPPSRAAVNNRIGAAVDGLGFLCCGIWALYAVRTGNARTLGRLGLAAGVAMSLGLGPNLGTWNGLQGHVSTAATVLMWILLLQFFVTFPRPKRVAESRLASWTVYGAWGALLVFLAAEMIVHPALYYTTGSVAGPLMLLYGLLVLAAVIHTLVSLPRAELRASGMHLILGGLLIAVLVLVLDLASTLRLPGWTNSLAIVAIPFTMALAVRKQARRADMRESTSSA